jgi:thiol-disulfide isomerase/thioredoxin
MLINMFNRIILSLLFILFISEATAQEKGISFFHGAWEEAITKAKSEKKLVFIDFYTKWCGPCKSMSDEIFVIKQIGDFYNQNFISIKIDAETATGAPIAKNYNVAVFPTYAFVDPQSLELVHYSTGRQEEEIFLLTGESALKNERRSSYLEKLAKEGSKDLSFMFEFAVYNASKWNRELADKYISMYIRESGYNLLNPGLWWYFNTFVKDKRNILAVEFLNNRDKYSTAYGVKKTDEILFSLFRSVNEAVELETAPEFPGKEYLKKRLALNQAIRNKDYALAKEKLDDIIRNPEGRTADFCRDINFMIRIPGGKYEDEVLAPELLEIYFILTRYAAYNNPDRNEGSVHYNYALLLEYMIKKSRTEEALKLLNSPDKGVGEYSMRPPGLEKKPVKR